jgi:hypothetical protein
MGRPQAHRNGLTKPVGQLLFLQIGRMAWELYFFIDPLAMVLAWAFRVLEVGEILTDFVVECRIGSYAVKEVPLSQRRHKLPSSCVQGRLPGTRLDIF